MVFLTEFFPRKLKPKPQNLMMRPWLKTAAALKKFSKLWCKLWELRIAGPAGLHKLTLPLLGPSSCLLLATKSSEKIPPALLPTA